MTAPRFDGEAAGVVSVRCLSEVPTGASAKAAAGVVVELPPRATMAEVSAALLDALRQTPAVSQGTAGRRWWKPWGGAAEEAARVVHFFVVDATDATLVPVAMERTVREVQELDPRDADTLVLHYTVESGLGDGEGLCLLCCALCACCAGASAGAAASGKNRRPQQYNHHHHVNQGGHCPPPPPAMHTHYGPQYQNQCRPPHGYVAYGQPTPGYNQAAPGYGMSPQYGQPTYYAQQPGCPPPPQYTGCR